jgi:hypothetical protein|tara:strand:- start:11 stop:175 length:165 start_codon:yes stop_codon:yes gene_type:complete
MRNDVEKLVTAMRLVNQLLDVTRTLGDDIVMPIVECELALLKRAREIDKIMMED